MRLVNDDGQLLAVGIGIAGIAAFLVCVGVLASRKPTPEPEPIVEIRATPTGYKLCVDDECKHDCDDINASFIDGAESPRFFELRLVRLNQCREAGWTP